MSLDNLFGLPAHPLIVHGAVVLLPVAAIATVVVAAVPRWRRPYALLVLGVSLAAAGAIWLAQESGESLEERVTETALVERHSELAEQVLPWAIAVVVVAAAVLLADRFQSRLAQIPSRAATITLIVAAVITGVGATWTVAEVGHSGAKATWHNVAPSDGD
jgi:hypothetical protein